MRRDEARDPIVPAEACVALAGRWHRGDGKSHRLGATGRGDRTVTGNVMARNKDSGNPSKMA